jgi:ABC-type branched-subunit amino acid transport system permease subunit
MPPIRPPIILLTVRVLWLLVIGSIQRILHSGFGFGLRAIRDSGIAPKVSASISPAPKPWFSP